MADNESTSVTKDLGIVSAYGYAKAAGYTGTEEEFEQIFLEFTENAPGLLDRLDDAVDAAEDAESTAVSAKNAAVDAKDAAVAAAATFETDTTLAVSGKAADAKVTGDNFTQLSTAFTDYVGDVVYSGTLTGTRYEQVTQNLTSGKYLLHVDSITSSDTEYTQSWIIFNQPNRDNVTIPLERNKENNVYFEILENSPHFTVYASEGSSQSAGDTFTFSNLQITKNGVLNSMVENVNSYANIPFHNLEKNPYQCNFEPFVEAISTTHAHCLNNNELVTLARKYDHVAISNYHPSVPVYPLKAFFDDPIRYTEYTNEQLSGTKYIEIECSLPSGNYIFSFDKVSSTDTDGTTCRIRVVLSEGEAVIAQAGRGDNISVEVSLSATSTKIDFYASYDALKSTGDIITLTGVTIYRLIPDVLDTFLVSPNAEQAGFPRAPQSFHMNSVGSFLSKETITNGKTVSQTIESAINSLQFPQMGGMTVNHPEYSELTTEFINSLLEFNNGFFALEIYNASCEGNHSKGYSLTQWDDVLKNGIQIYGVAVPDHEAQYHPLEDRQGFGYCHVMVRAKTEQQILQAYSIGRFYSSIYNDDLKFTNLYYLPNTGFEVETSKTCTIKFITANGTTSTVTGATATYLPTYNDIYVRVEATDGVNTLYSNAVIIESTKPN